MKSEPLNIRMLMAPLKPAVARNAPRAEESAAAAGDRGGLVLVVMDYTKRKSLS